MKEKNKNINANRLGLIFSLAICVLALGVGALSARDRTEKLGSKDAVTTKSVVEIRKNQTNVQKDTTSTASTSTTTKKATTKSTVAKEFAMPIEGKIIKEYSEDTLIYSDTFCDWRLHGAVDIKASTGEKVKSAGAGKVLDVYTDEMLGKVVKIDHGNKIICYYCGLDTVDVKKNDKVTLGQKLGTLGKIPCESADETHLHFYVEKNDATVNPLDTLRIKTK